VALRQDEFISLSDDVDLDRDRVLVERCQSGDSAAFGNLYARYYDRLLRFCLRRLNDRHEAEDAAQEAFARAWKALPGFAGERRFYPWLSVIAGNICTDMLRRRSRSTPTDDLELSARQQVGGGGNETSEELVLAAVDGELVNRALGRLSVRHRDVLAMREGSGWTYQQIADHEGVEIGTIETLLWRARQALKREFTVLSESKGILGGFLAAGALLRRGLLRVAHRGTAVQQSGGTPGLRNALAGVALTSAAVAAALVTPHALATSGSSGPSGSAATRAAAAAANLASPSSFTSDVPSGGGGSSGGSGGSSDAGGLAAPTPLNANGSPVTAAGSATAGLPGLGSSGLSGAVSGASSVVTGLGNAAQSAVGTLTGGILGPVLTKTKQLLTPSAPNGDTTASTTSTTSVVGGVTKTIQSVPETVNSTVKAILGGL
jgi:RNA polymerase sigma-70 factor (ECF subfamily)